MSIKSRRLRPMDLPPPVSPLRSGGSGALVGGSLAPAAGSETTPTPPPAVPTPPGVQTLDAPTGLSLASTVLSMSGVVGKWHATVTWDVVSNAASYHLEWTPLADFSTPQVIDTNQPYATFEVYMSVAYQVRVQAIGADGARSDWSSTLSFTPDIDPTAPGVPTSQSAAFADGGDLVISWTKGSGAQLKDTLVDLFATSDMSGAYLRRFEVAGNSFTWSIYDNLAAGGLTTVYVRLSSRSYAGVLSAAVSTSATFALPAAPTVTAAWNQQTGAMTLTWTPAARAVAYLVYIDGHAKPELSGTSYTYSFVENKADHSGVPYQSLPYGVQAKDVFGRYGAQTTGTTNAPSPPLPTALAASFDSPDAHLSWAISEPVYSFDVVIDGVSRAIAGTSYVYPFALNTSEHSGTPDPVLTVQIRSRNILDMVSAYATITATNPAPSAPSSVTATGYSSAMAIAVAATLPSDLKALTYRIIKDGVTLESITSTNLQLTYTAPSSGSYQIGVLVTDVFNQASSEALSSSVVMDVLTTAMLRAGISYRDNLNTASSTLDLLKDDVRTGSGVTYPGT